MFNSASIFGGRISRTSSLILTFLFILAGLILFLSPVSHAAQVTLAWDPETDPNVTGYRVYYGTSSRNYPFNKDAGNNTTITVPNLQDGATYYFAVTAYNAAGIESGYSNEVSYSATATCPYTISPLSQSFSSSGGAGTVSVSSQSGCSWTAASNASWIVVTSNSNGVGSRTVNYSVSTNTGAASRTGTLTIAGQTFTVTQSGASQTQYTLSVTKTGTGTGTVTNNPSGSTFNAGAVVTLSATPYASSTFAGWSGGCSGTSSTCSINMTNNTSVIAAFTLKSYAITATSGANGSISPSGSVGVNYGATQRFIITPNSGYRVEDVKVDANSVGPVTSYRFANVTRSHTIQASFSSTSKPVVADTTSPTVTGFSIPKAATALTVSITTFTANDNVGVTGYLLTESATKPSAAAAGWSPSPPGTYRFTAAGSKTLYAWAKDAAGNVSTTLSASVAIALNGPASVPAILGIYRGGAWYWDNNGNGIWDGCGADTCIESFGLPGDIPVAGDWTGDGILKIGVYRQGQWYLDQNGNGIWDGCGVDTCIESFGLPGDIPVAGDWTGTGIAKIGIYRQGQWYLDKNGNGIWDDCGLDTCIESFGGYPEDIPVVGDWTGTGVAKIGIYRQGQWYLDKNGNGIWDDCGLDTCIESFGGYSEDIPVVGDWTGTGISGIGIYRQGHWYHDKNGNGIWDGCGVDTCTESFGGIAGDIPFTK